MPSKQTDNISTAICACGCGEEFVCQDSRGRPRKFIHGHNAKGIGISQVVERLCPECNTCKPGVCFYRWGRSYPACADCSLRRAGIARLVYTYKVDIHRAANLYDQTTCDICGGDASGKNGHVDHSHITSEVRGKLCSGCNWALGNVKDNPETLMAAAAYLLQRENVLGEVR